MAQVTWRQRVSAALRAGLDPQGKSAPASDPTALTHGGPRKIELAKKAYEEVLDATKHQDDKVGRFLTAIAFLTTGAIALIARDNGLRREFKVPGGGEYPLLAWSAGAFFVLTIGSVALLLLCLSVPVRLPQSRRDPMKGSHLFYSYIAARPARDWRHEWDKCAPCLEKDITDDYVREAHNLAERTAAKYRHSFEASWLFVFALLFLGISIYFKIESIFHPKGSPVPLKTDDLLLLAGIVFLHAALQIYTRVVHDWRSMQKLRDFEAVKNLNAANRASAKTTKRSRRAKAKTLTSGQAEALPATRQDAQPTLELRRNFAMHPQRRWSFTLWLAVGAFSVWLALPRLVASDWWLAVTAGVVALTVGGPLFATRGRWDDTGHKTQSLWRGVWPWRIIVTASAIIYATVAVAQDGLWRLIGVLLPAAGMSAFNVARPGLAQRRTRRFELATASPPQMRREVPGNACPTCLALEPVD